MSDRPVPDRARATAPTVLEPDFLEPLGRAFFERPALEVARAAIGAIVLHRSAAGVAAGRIVETEAYQGPEDQAAHSAGGRRTKRNESMWGAAGHAYLFMLYGQHWALNLVTGRPEQPHAVLVRALEPLPPFDVMVQRRGMPADRVELTNGPGKLCAALGLDGSQDGADLCGGSPLLVAAGRGGAVGTSARINIDYAGDWVGKPWRLYERGNRYVSVKPRD